MKDSQKCSLTQQKTNRLSNQRGIPRSENPKHKTLISWLNPKYTFRDAICFTARGVSIQPRLQIITMTKKDCWNREHLTRLCPVHPISPWHHFMPTLSRRHERDCDQISSNILGVLQQSASLFGQCLYHLECLLAGILPFKKYLNHLMNTNPTLESHFIVWRRYTCSLPALVGDPSYAFTVSC